MKVLITAGATREPIDGVRFITNFSTGATGAFLAERLAKTGHDILYLHGAASKLPGESSGRIHLRPFDTFHDLDRELKSALAGGSFHAVVHAAAVSDFSVHRIRRDGREFPPPVDSKLSSLATGTDRRAPSGGDLEIVLKPNFKILNRLKTYAGPAGRTRLRVIGFKLTRTPDEAQRLLAVTRLFSEKGTVDYVVQNDLSELTSDRHPFRVFRDDGEPVGSGNDKSGMFHVLRNLIEGSQS